MTHEEARQRDDGRAADEIRSARALAAGGPTLLAALIVLPLLAGLAAGGPTAQGAALLLVLAVLALGVAGLAVVLLEVALRLTRLDPVVAALLSWPAGLVVGVVLLLGVSALLP